MPTVKGLDVSSYQGYVNWTSLRRAGVKFGAAKATEGLGYHDPTFPHNWQGMETHGIVRGAYHFLRASHDGRSQADYHHAYVRDHGHYKLGDFCLVDVEVMDGQSPDVVIQCLVDFVTRALEQIAKQVVVYTDPGFWDELGNPQDKIILHRPLWLASISKQAPSPLPGWPVVSFWQYSWTEYTEGISGPHDADLFLGDMTQLKQVLKWP